MEAAIEVQKMPRPSPIWIWSSARPLQSATRTIWTCRYCRTVSVPITTTTTTTSDPVSLSSRAFSTSPVHFKKGGKASRVHAQTDSTPPVSGSASSTAVDEVFDFSALEANILKALEHLTHDLSRLRAGGRFNPETLESLRVQLAKGSKQTVRLGDLAQVIPKGRIISVVVGDPDHVKAVSSAILSSPHSLVPQGPNDPAAAPTTLTITVPPPTGESRQAALASASKAGEEASARIRSARAAHQKKLRAMELAKKVRPDDLQKAQKRMEEIVRRGGEEVKRIVDGAKRVLES